MHYYSVKWFSATCWLLTSCGLVCVSKGHVLVSEGVLREIPCVHCLLNSDAIENQYLVSPGLAKVLWLYGSRMTKVGILNLQKCTVTSMLIPTTFKGFVLVASFLLKSNSIAFSVCITKTLSVIACLKKYF